MRLRIDAPGAPAIACALAGLCLLVSGCATTGGGGGQELTYRFRDGAQAAGPQAATVFDLARASVDGDMVLRGEGGKPQKISFLLLRDGDNLRFTAYKGLSSRLADCLVRGRKYWAAAYGRPDVVSGEVTRGFLEWEEAGQPVRLLILQDLFCPQAARALYRLDAQAAQPGDGVKQFDLIEGGPLRKSVKSDPAGRVTEQAWRGGGTEVTVLYSDYVRGDGGVEYPRSVRLLRGDGRDLATVTVRGVKRKETVKPEVFDVGDFQRRTQAMRSAR